MFPCQILVLIWEDMRGTVVERWLGVCFPCGNHAESVVLKELKIRAHAGGARKTCLQLGLVQMSTVKKSPLALGKVSIYRR